MRIPRHHPRHVQSILQDMQSEADRIRSSWRFLRVLYILGAGGILAYIVATSCAQ